MNRWTAYALHITTVILAITGLLYAGFHYLMEPPDAFAVINHPLEPYLIKIHIVLAPALVLLFGIILSTHILAKAVNGSRFGRKSGLLMAWLFGIMAMSGYLLQVIDSDARRIALWIHLISGAIWALGYGIHQISSFHAKRFMASQRKTLVAFAVLTLAILAANRLRGEPPEPYERRVQAMGTELRLIVFPQQPDSALEASEDILRAIENAEQQLSTWRKDSELSRLNRHPVSVPFPLSPSLCRVLEETERWVARTSGAFDPGIGTLSDAWDIHGLFRIPSDEETESARRRAGMRYIELDRKNCTATRNGDVRIDPGAFGKGEALDRAARSAEEKKTGPIFLDFGGQVLVSGPIPGRAPWKVAIADPEDRSRTTTIEVQLVSGSLSTSGGSQRDGQIRGQRISHILDPRTGKPVPSFGSVTVWRSSALEADILSTALYVMGPGKGKHWAEENKIAACFLISDSTGYQTLMTSDFARLVK